MVNRSTDLQILSHRACLHGGGSVEENTLAALGDAIEHGFEVEFDIRRDSDSGQLVLSHDPAAWSQARDATTFLRDPGPDGAGRHALNVKDPDVVDDVLAELERAGTADRFFLFDFELLGCDAPALMRAVQRRGFAVAHRLSERERHLERYLDDDAVTMVWLDEFETPWVERRHVAELAARSKQTFYVSPELHRPLPPEAVEQRWRELAEWGVTGICTDYPVRLRDLLEATP